MSKNWEEEYGYSNAVRSGDLLFCSGQVGLEADGSAPADPTRQYDLAFETIGKLLAEHGAAPADLVELISFHVDFPQHMTEFMAAKARFQNGARPAWTAVGVAALGMPGVLVEVKATARIGGA
ncbi:RidA family protein [Prescottella equi]|uniref:RidA family protein n=1 Tax=Rhodococcus hoagii TaxID=43767 RepID=A0AAE4ZF61_RHOHA|nr:RidA family protein [Prescottella equi]ERN47498.1 endoribonuclease [Prescottella equi NBRC 101255 = C 7]MBM4522456.1 RidA family protein [Prescottella equi]MBM4525010.1 RidA family protein [Prescottella equi]MBM4627175.1 RidA family protein [Prescottella equi]MBM4650816.1 RidA family protein [Prescottella equi]